MGAKINEEEKHFLAILENGLFLPRFSPCVNVNISGKQSLRDENRKKTKQNKIPILLQNKTSRVIQGTLPLRGMKGPPDPKGWNQVTWLSWKWPVTTVRELLSMNG